MNNEVRLLAMSILAILEEYQDSKRFNSFDKLDKLREYNIERKEEEIIDEYGDPKIKKTEVVKNEELQKNIAIQEREVVERFKELRLEADEILGKNSKKIKIIKNILNEILDKNLEAKNNSQF